VSVELAFYAAEDAEELIVAHLIPLRWSSAFRKAGDPLPFTLVTHIAGTESVGEGRADPIVSVHTLCDKALGVDAAMTESRNTHRRMLLLANGIDAVTLTGGRIAGIDYLEVVESPRWEFYSDGILRKVGRYQIGLAYVPAQ
jgi:hypothetical protein